MFRNTRDHHSKLMKSEINAGVSADEDVQKEDKHHRKSFAPVERCDALSVQMLPDVVQDIIFLSMVAAFFLIIYIFSFLNATHMISGWCRRCVWTICMLVCSGCSS